MDKNGFITNNLSALDQHRRLSYLGMKREASLDATKRRKVYKPKLNVVRNKWKPKEITHKQERQQAKQRKLTKDTPTYVSSSGIFSEAMATNSRRTLTSDRCFSNHHNASESHKIPKLLDEEKVVQQLLTDEDLDSEFDDEEEYQPVGLPLASNKGTFKHRFGLSSIKTEVNEELRSSPELSCDGTDPFNFRQNNACSDDNMSLSLIVFPHALAGKGFDKNDDKVDYDLSQMAEGRIGTIKLLKSGKMDVQIGNAFYHLHALQRTPFKETLVYVAEIAESVKDVTAMGSIDNNYMVTPRWSHLFNQKNKQLKSSITMSRSKFND